MELDSLTSIDNGQRLSLQQLAHYCFDRLGAVGQRFSRVATAKTLHILSPNFFIIWDSGISQTYRELSGMGKHTCDGWFYSYKFLPSMKRLLEAIIKDASKQTPLDRASILGEIRKGFGFSDEEKTITKLIDEYNYIMFTKGQFLRIFQATAGN